jgi:hypothetical protein
MPRAAETYLVVFIFLHDTQIKVTFLIIRDGNLRLIMARQEGQNFDSTKKLIKRSFEVMSSNL